MADFFNKRVDGYEDHMKSLEDADEHEEKEMLIKYIEIKKSGLLKEGELYHIDIPFSVRTQKKLLTEAGFNVVDVIFQKGNGAIIVSQRA